MGATSSKSCPKCPTCPTPNEDLATAYKIIAIQNYFKDPRDRLNNIKRISENLGVPLITVQKAIAVMGPGNKADIMKRAQPILIRELKAYIESRAKYADDNNIEPVPLQEKGPTNITKKEDEQANATEVVLDNFGNGNIHALQGFLMILFIAWILSILFKK